MGELLAECTIDVHPQTVAAVIRVESNGDPLAIAPVVLRKDRARLPRIRSIPRSNTIGEAVAKAESLINRGYSVSLGLMQINDMHYERFGVSVADLFNPCMNIKIGTTILSENYIQAGNVYENPRLRMVGMLSAYNTGRYKGSTQGARYASRVIEKAGAIKDPDSVLSKLAVQYLQPTPRERVINPVLVTHLGYNPVDPHAGHNHPPGQHPVDFSTGGYQNVLSAPPHLDAFCSGDCKQLGHKGKKMDIEIGGLQ